MKTPNWSHQSFHWVTCSKWWTQNLWFICCSTSTSYSRQHSPAATVQKLKTTPSRYESFTIFKFFSACNNHNNLSTEPPKVLSVLCCGKLEIRQMYVFTPVSITLATKHRASCFGGKSRFWDACLMTLVLSRNRRAWGWSPQTDRWVQALLLFRAFVNMKISLTQFFCCYSPLTAGDEKSQTSWLVTPYGKAKFTHNRTIRVSLCNTSKEALLLWSDCFHIKRILVFHKRKEKQREKSLLTWRYVLTIASFDRWDGGVINIHEERATWLVGWMH